MTLAEELKDRADKLNKWLTDNEPACFTEQKHCSEGTIERAYWHYGYMIAIRDVMRLLNSGTVN